MVLLVKESQIYRLVCQVGTGIIDPKKEFISPSKYIDKAWNICEKWSDLV